MIKKNVIDTSNGKANEELSNAFSKVGFRLINKKKPMKKDWDMLTEGFKNHYIQRYFKLTKDLK